MLSTNQTSSRASWVMDILFIGILLGVFYAIFIGGYALFTPDEGRYSEVAREMVASGDFVTPRLNGVAFLDKPALYYWLQASAIKLFGIKEWALRFWPAFVGVLGCLMAYTLGRTLYNRRSAILAAFILATAPLYYGAAHYANLDLEVGVLISITLSFSLLALQTSSDKNRSRFFIAAYVFAGLATLTKGLIGIAFPMLIIGSWILLLNRWHMLKKMRILTGFIIFSVIALPWYVMVQKANPEFLHFFFVTQQFSRFLTQGDFNNRTVLWFYVPTVLIGALPWSVFFIQALSKNIKSVWQARAQHANELFLLLWFGLIFIFFSIPKSKTVGYIIPVLMPLAIMTGHFLDSIWNNVKSVSFTRGVKVLIAINLMVAIACIVATQVHAPRYIYIGSTPYLLFTAALNLIAATVITYCYRKQAFQKILAGIGCFAVANLLLLLACTSIMNQRSIKPIAMQLKARLQPGDEVVSFQRFYQDLPIYLERKITIVADWNSPNIAKNDNWQRELWYGMPFQDTREWLIDENTFWQRWHSSKPMYVIMNANLYPAFLKKAQNSVRQTGLIENRDVIWVSNKL